MFNLPSNPYGGHRKYFPVTAKIVDIKVIRPFLNLFKKTKVFYFEFDKSSIIGDFKDVDGKSLPVTNKGKCVGELPQLVDKHVGDTVDFAIGYANENQQFYQRVKPFIIEFNYQ